LVTQSWNIKYNITVQEHSIYYSFYDSIRWIYWSMSFTSYSKS